MSKNAFRNSLVSNDSFMFGWLSENKQTGEVKIKIEIKNFRRVFQNLEEPFETF